MTFAELFHELPETKLAPEVAEKQVSAICIDSRRMQPDSLFVCVPGTRVDGREFAAKALADGAALVAGEGPAPADIPAERWVRLPDARHAIPTLACTFFRNPSHQLAVYAVTGTNGKTTTATLLRAVLAEAGLPCGLLSTVVCDLGDRTEDAAQTTPDATILQAHFAHMLAAGCKAVSIEVSSHALSQHRTEGIRFAAAAFTNLTQDHLDYHRTMESYGLAKRRLFEQLAENPDGLAVVNLDDPWGRKLLEWLQESGVPAVTYGLDGAADFRAEAISLAAHATQFRLVTPHGRADLSTSLLGRHNISNMLATAALASKAIPDPARVAHALSRQPPVRGRLERVETSHHPATIFVDYAHTPDALQHALSTLRELTCGRLIVVFGCGGDRDRGKRPLMGRIAHDLADIVVLTSDNPRRESPSDILAGILAGMPPKAASVRVHLDRREAIRAALHEATAPGDIVLVAGKGHETSQIFADHTVPFDDRKEILCITGEAT